MDRITWFRNARMGKFYLDKRYYADKAARWVSFESTPQLEETRRDIYGKCVPCISNLYEQLQAGKTLVDLGPAYNCWKVVAVLTDDDECLQVLAELEKEFLGERKIKGRFGSGDEQKTTKVIVFSAPNEQEKNRLFEASEHLRQARKPGGTGLFPQRLCRALSRAFWRSHELAAG